EELLIDFRELVGEHLGENMAEVVWQTLTTYRIEDRIITFVLDNTMNNGTMIEEIKRRAALKGIPLDASWSRLWCMPHIVHLSALKVSLPYISAISGGSYLFI
ncbi:hypothetical protein CPC08DRAFT_647470, partial [Agrocybe pediades]